MSNVTLEYAICKWENRESAEYFPINNSNTHEAINGKQINTVFDAYGRQLGEANFNYPRPPFEEDLHSDSGIKYFRFNSDNDQKIIVYRRSGYQSNDD